MSLIPTQSTHQSSRQPKAQLRDQEEETCKELGNGHFSFFAFSRTLCANVIIFLRSVGSLEEEFYMTSEEKIHRHLFAFFTFQGAILNRPAMHPQGNESTICGEDRGRGKVHFESRPEHSR